MRKDPHAVIAALALAACLPSAAPAQNDPDNPPIETIKSITGDPIRVQRFQRSAVDLDPAVLRIGQRKMLRAAFGDLVGQERTVRVECPAMASGRIDADLNCRPVSGADGDIMPARLAMQLMKSVASGFPPIIPEVPVSSLRKMQRLIQFDVHMRAFPAAEPEPPAGSIVDAKEINGLNALRRPLDYPAGARRRDVEGRMVALCQVQADLSVSCAQESFDPPEHAQLFTLAALGLFQAGRVEPLLANGGKAEGARFRYAVNFSLAK